jgi:hypothetical protein
MNVIPLRERARFFVESESGEDPYLVDLLEYRRQGWCNCKNFAVTIEPAWNAGEKPVPSMCKHICRARAYLANLVEELSGLTLSRAQAVYQVDRILFRWAREESMNQLNPKRYGATRASTPHVNE